MSALAPWGSPEGKGPVGRHQRQQVVLHLGSGPAFPHGQLQTPELAKGQKGISALPAGWPVSSTAGPQDEVQLLGQGS